MPLPILFLRPGTFGRRPVPTRCTVGIYGSQVPSTRGGLIHAPFPPIFVLRDPAQRHGVRVRVLRVGIERAEPPKAPAGVHMVASEAHWAVWVAQVERVRPAQSRRTRVTKGRAG